MGATSRMIGSPQARDRFDGKKCRSFQKLTNAVRSPNQAKGLWKYCRTPFAWFGDRTAFVNFWNDLHFFPSNRSLAWGLPIILDVAPIVDGYPADIGYSCVFGQNEL